MNSVFSILSKLLQLCETDRQTDRETDRQTFLVRKCSSEKCLASLVTTLDLDQVLRETYIDVPQESHAVIGGAFGRRLYQGLI